MKKYIYLFLFSALIFSCSDSETDNSIDNLTIEEHIQLIKNHEGKIEINFDELPEFSQNHINDLENNITAELILYAENIGYEVKLRRQSRNLVSFLNILYIYFNGELLFDENYDEDNDGYYDVFEEWDNYMCFDIQFPISVTMPDESQISIANEDELYEAVESYYEMSDEYDGLPEINFPINIIFYFDDENGNEIEEIVGVGSYEELEMYFEICEDGWDDDGWGDEDWYEIDCFDLVYPLTIVNPEGEVLTVDSENNLHEYIDQYYENCNSNDCGDFNLYYPLTVEYYSETNDQNQILTINSEEELQELLDEYCYNDGDDEEGFDTCGEIVYPITVEAPNGDQLTGNSEEEIMLLIEEWYSNNCNTMECDADFELVFPITMQFEDDQGDIITMTIQSEVMLEEISEQYCED
jgi:hypothetical protein